MFAFQVASIFHSGMKGLEAAHAQMNIRPADCCPSRAPAKWLIPTF